jgi:hypothetical protein
MFARLGNDERAKVLLKGLDNHETLGKWVDRLPVESEYLDRNNCEGKKYWKMVNILLSFYVRATALLTELFHIEKIEKLMLGALFPEVSPARHYP